MKFGKLYRVGSRWEQALLDVTTWRFFKDGEFEETRPDVFIAYVMSEDDQYRGDLFIFPVNDFSTLIAAAPRSGGKHKTYISRDVADLDHWVLRRQSTQFNRITDETCIDVSGYRRNFDVLEPS